MAETLVETYLGRDAGRRVMQGRIERGVADRIKTVLWFSDLHGYTRISDSAEPEQIIPLLNDYADAIVSAIHAHSGDVLKLIGDGVLAIFPAQDRARATAAALEAAKEARAAVAALNDRRGAEGLPTTDMYLGLHLGVVFYGNIGSQDRLDFTVVGPAVNEVSRIAAMCRSVDQPILISSTFVESFASDRRPFVSVGRLRPARGRQAAGTVHARPRRMNRGHRGQCLSAQRPLRGGIRRELPPAPFPALLRERWRKAPDGVWAAGPTSRRWCDRRAKGVQILLVQRTPSLASRNPPASRIRVSYGSPSAARIRSMMMGNPPMISPGIATREIPRDEATRLARRLSPSRPTIMAYGRRLRR